VSTRKNFGLHGLKRKKSRRWAFTGRVRNEVDLCLLKTASLNIEIKFLLMSCSKGKLIENNTFKITFALAIDERTE
jgi:hypothetical protein